MSASAAALLASTLLPALVFADTYYPYDTNYYGSSYSNCNWYGSSNYNGNYNCNNQGTLSVYVQVQNTYGGYRSASDFTMYVSGANTSQQYFQGSQDGTTLQLNGSYSVSVYNQNYDYTPTYSSGCTGTMGANDSRICYVTLTNSNSSYYPSYTYPYNQYQQPYYQQPVTYVSKYVPSLPNTGFEPTNSSAIAFSFAVVLVAAGTLLFYVRKAFTAVLS